MNDRMKIETILKDFQQKTVDIYDTVENIVKVLIDNQDRSIIIGFVIGILFGICLVFPLYYMLR